MIVGTTIFRLNGPAYYTPEFPRGGLAATFVVDVTHIIVAGGGALDIEVEHRNSEDTTWASAGTFGSISGTITDKLDVTGLREIVRLKFTFGGSQTSTDAAHFLVQAPSWRPY